MKNLDLAISQLESILLPFASNPVWNEVHTHMKLYPNQLIEKYKEHPSAVLHKAWWEYFSNLDVKASIVFDLMRATGGDGSLYDGTPYQQSYINDEGIDLRSDTWKEAWGKLHRRCNGYSADGQWFIWLVSSEFLFEYNCQDNPLNICTSYVKHLELHMRKINIEDYIHYQK